MKQTLLALLLLTTLSACGASPATTTAPTTPAQNAATSAPAATMESSAAPTMAMGEMPTAGSMPMDATDQAGGMNMGSGMNTPAGTPLPTLTPGVPASIPAATPDLAAFPVTIQNCGRALTFAKPPERAVALYSLTAEFLLRLGLQNRIVGAAFTGAEPVASDLRTAFNALPVMTTDSAPNKEVLLNAQPDFVIDNFPGLFYNTAGGAASREELQANGAQAYTLTSRCEGNEANGKVADIYTDIENLGNIFGVSDRAEQLVEQLKARVAAVQAKIANQPKLRVLVYDSGIGPINIFGPGAIADTAVLAGGENVFPGGNSEFLMLSAEEVAARDPEVFVVFDRQGTRQMSMGADLNAQEAADFLIKTFPNTTAAKNKRVAIVPYQQAYAGLQTIDGVETLAKQFYPEAFK